MAVLVLLLKALRTLHSLLGAASSTQDQVLLPDLHPLRLRRGHDLVQLLKRL